MAHCNSNTRSANSIARATGFMWPHTGHTSCTGAAESKECVCLDLQIIMMFSGRNSCVPQSNSRDLGWGYMLHKVGFKKYIRTYMTLKKNYRNPSSLVLASLFYMGVTRIVVSCVDVPWYII